jgi:hypothetical protein
MEWQYRLPYHISGSTVPFGGYSDPFSQVCNNHRHPGLWSEPIKFSFWLPHSTSSGLLSCNLPTIVQPVIGAGNPLCAGRRSGTSGSDFVPRRIQAIPEANPAQRRMQG